MTKKFKLTEWEWEQSLGLATKPAEAREKWWAELGELLGFDPKTVDFVRPLVFTAEEVAPAPEPEAAPEEEAAPEPEPEPEPEPAPAPEEEVALEEPEPIDVPVERREEPPPPEDFSIDDLPEVEVKARRRDESPSTQPEAEPLPGAVPPRETPSDEPRAPRDAATVASANSGDVVQVDQILCGRCGQRHHGVTFLRLDRPVVVGSETLTHWAWCPATGQPMLLLIDADTDVRVPSDPSRPEDNATDLGDDEAATHTRTSARSEQKENE